MKRNLFLVGLALGTAATLVGCSQSSPTAPKQPTPSTFGITLTVSPNVAGINESITAIALVTVGGASAPDGTPVTFNASGVAQFVGASTPQQVVSTTVGGRAGVTITATSGGAGLITATVPNKSASAQVNFKGVSPTQVAIISVLPNRGTPQGGGQVVISGQGFVAPLTVNFVVGGVAYPATFVSVAGDGSSVTVLTPQVPSSTGDQVASVQVTLTGVVAPGGGTLSATLANAFTYGADTGTPQLYSMLPSSGSANGGDIITLTGKYFTEPLQVSFVFAAATVPGQVTSVQHGADGVDTAQVVTPKVTISGRTVVNVTITNMAGTATSKSATFNQVFTFNPPVTGPPVIYYISPTYGSVAGNDTVTIFGTNFAAPASVSIGATSETVQSISGDGTWITVLTHAVGGVVPTTAQDVTVTTAQGSVTLPAAFTYVEGQTPALYVLTPNLGPLEGGTRVTITGAGFQYPVQVMFGSLQAQVVSNNYNQVVCISPSITASQPSTPTTVSVTVTNTGTGKVSNALPFTYGQAMFISAIAPGLGPDTGGTSVTILGQGFSSPVAVSFAGVPAQVLSVAGTQVVAKTGAVLQRSCSPVSGPVSVTNISSNISATGPTWTYTPASPLITGIVASGCTGASGNTVRGDQAPCTLTITGSNFESNMQLGLTNPVTTIPENSGGSSTQAVFTLTSSLESLGIKYNTAACANGTQNLITPIDVKITDPANNCSNTLAGGLLVQPSDTSCKVTTPLTMTLAPATASIAGGTTITYAVNFSRPAQASDGANMTVLISPSGSGVIASPTSLTVPIAVGQQTATFNVQAGTNAGTATITASYGGVSATANLTVTTATNGIIFTPGALNLAPGQGSNIGISINPPAATATAVTVTLVGPSGVVVSPAFPQTVNVPAGGSGTLAITAGTTAGTVTLQGSATGLTTGTATVTVTAPAVSLTLTPAAQTLLPMQSASLNVTINPAPSAPATVNLTLAGPSGVLASPVFPTTVTVPVSGTVSVPITAGATNGTVTINGAYGSATATATVTVETTPLTLTMAPASQTLAVGGTANFVVSVNQAQPVAINVYITQNGPNGVISFTGVNPGPPAYVTIPANQSFTNFTVNGLTVGGPVTITGTLPAAYGGGSATSTVTVNSFILTLSPDPLSLGVGATANMTVSLNNPAPTTTAVTLTSASPGIATVSSPVTFAAGATTATAIVTGVGPGTTTITAGPVASLGGAQATATVTVTPYTFTLSPNPMVLTPGATATLTATLNNPAPSGHTTQLVIGAVPSGIATLGSNTLVFAPGTTMATTVVTAVGAGTATVPANLQIDAVTVSTSNWTVTTVTTITLTANPNAITGWVGGQFVVQLTLSSPAPAAITVPLVVTGPTGVLSLLPTSVTFAAGANTAQFTITANQVSPNGVPNVVVATLPSQYGGGQAQVTVTINLPLTFTPATVTTVVGSPVQVIVTMASAQPAPTTVTLTWAGTLPAPAIPGSVTILANTTFTTFTIPATAAATGSITGTLPPGLPQGLGGATANLPVTIQ